MAKITGGAILVRSLLDQGASHMFTLSGNQILSIYDATIGTALRLIDVRHEGAAASMADAWARVTGQPGVCLVAGGPGHTNAITGIATAQAADSPIIWLSGASEASLRGMGAMQELAQVRLAQPVTKWAAEVSDIRKVPAMVEEAYRVATTGRPGPVHLSLPSDLMESSVDEDEVHFPARSEWREAARHSFDRSLVRDAETLLVSARRPAVIAGSGAFWYRAGPAIRQLIEKMRLPLFTIESARGLVSDDHPCCFGYADPLLNPVAEKLAEADVVLIVGKKLDFRVRYGQIFADDARLIQVDADPASIGGNRQPGVAIAGHPAAVVEQLLERPAAPTSADSGWLAELEATQREHAQDLASGLGSNDTPIHPLRLAGAVCEVMPRDTVLTFDAGDFVQWSRTLLPARRPGAWLRLGPMATLGCSIPYAIAARLARPQYQAIALAGDGGAGFHLMEFDTAVRHNIPFLLVVANDAGWGTEKQLQIGIYGEDRTPASDLLPTRYDRIVEAIGGHGEYVERPEELKPALERAIRSGKPACVNVRTRCVPSPQTLRAVARRRPS